MMSEMLGTSWMVALRINVLQGLLSGGLRVIGSVGCITVGGSGLFGDGEGELHLDCRVEGERVDADGGADVLAGVAEELEEEFAGAVGDLRLGGKGRIAGDERPDAEDAGELVEGDDRGGGGEAVDDAL